jgi:hypothetical protein
MKYLLVVFSTFILNHSYSQYYNYKTKSHDLFCSYNRLLKEFNSMQFDVVEGYSFNCGRSETAFDYELVDLDRNISKTASNKRVLNKEERNMLSKLINKKSNYTTSFPDSKGCFYPRMGFIFYNKSHEIIAHLDICLECNQILYENYLLHSSCQTDFYEKGVNRFNYLCSYFKLKCP